MRCYGRSKSGGRCKNTTKFFVCHSHRGWLGTILIPILIPFYPYIVDKIVGKDDIVELTSEVKKIYHVLNLLSTEFKNERVSSKLDTVTESGGNPYEYDQDTAWVNVARSAITYYNKGNYMVCGKILKRIFSDDEVQYLSNNAQRMDRQILQRYVSYCYVSIKEPEKAAVLLLEANRSKKHWDYSNLIDLATCLRHVTLKSNIVFATTFIDSLNTIYKTEILSPVWAAVPFHYANAVMRNDDRIYPSPKYSRPLINDIQYIIDRYPNNRFISYAYLATENYQAANKFSQNSRIEDICLYSYARYQMRSVQAYYKGRNISVSDGKDIDLNSDVSTILANTISDKKTVSDVYKCIGLFEELISRYPKSLYKKKASYWVSWLYASIGKYDEAVENLLENPFNSTDLEYLIQKYVSNPKLILKLVDSQSIDNERIEFNIDIKTFDLLSVEELEKIIYKEIHLYNSYLINYIPRGDFKKVTRMNSILIEYSKMHRDNEADSDDLSYIYQLFNFRAGIEEAITNQNQQSLKHILISSKEISHQLAYEFYEYIKGRLDLSQIPWFQYFEIRILGVISPNLVSEKVDSFVKKFPKDKLTDDALAEGVFNSFLTIDQPDDGFKFLETLTANYKNTNALDNALNVLARHYMYFIENNGVKSNEVLENSIRLNKYIIDAFPLGSYKKQAEERLAITRRIQNVPEEKNILNRILGE